VETGVTNLVKRAQKGDADAFAQLVQSQMQNMYKAARAIVRNDEDAADAISETILVCWEKIGQLRKTEYFRTWMTKILINNCNDILRKRKMLCYGDEMQEPSVKSEEYNNVEWMEVLQGMDERYRLVMVLHYVNGLNTVQISDVLQMPASTVRTRLARGREQIASVYGDFGKRSHEADMGIGENGGRYENI
jgi:RNA polymerase sigma-70 factor (ECF subfamily)